MTYRHTLDEIEGKRLELERYLAELMSKELGKWQNQHGLNVSDVNIRLDKLESLGSAPIHIVTGVSVDLDYKP